ncbi:uncharacterized protein PITG_21835 [Phytophthora infestans T30-4]|uniref:Uncharacterized protein n=2 Tax=Phytophthora infestans TaxID=4787 RepID=D0P4I8_PHYIT|nr:uncharacterized protein PITG_21835 [Phytophthora infestans T30-4]EEY66686.1 hypothetical protein PITG_21835 [Phytophthora infestans T30-4]KAF4046196.1 hypothetical protein GN244_ATG01424 [Phytophthora infestans]KAF4136187.1 hypothetical protein GN958_ATG14627 [Phytophthora infestans]|eukprot:XP_002894786.1 hypothetical protein PITG_21835 [Phytophthora infestans T30-4]
MPGRLAPKQLQMRLRLLKRTYGKQLARFPRASYTYIGLIQMQPISPEFAYSFQPKPNARRYIFSDDSAADVRQQAGKPEGKLGSYYLQLYQELFALLGL